MELYIILIIMIIGSLVAIKTRNILSSILSIGLVGLLLCVAFLYLGAPDIAITQLVVEVVVLIVMLRATINKNIIIIDKTLCFPAIAMVVFIIGFILIFFHRAISDLPEFGRPLMPVSGEYLLSGLEKTGAANIVASIILDFRAYDTLGEATVIFVAIAGAVVLLRKKGKI
ncbi:MAG TPA: DUF4040 domain-containing protein [Candidatus Omnitrophica bacterium]|jgi:multicomponent Na+:H+ antiporter subunit B|nr:DUF4040 domain-containing protein [Candidatus Omnitrophota bacterium]